MNTVTFYDNGHGKFFPCSKETYLELKKLNFWLLQSKRQASAWDRWRRKMPHNRKMAEPYVNDFFVSKEPDQKLRWTGRRTHKTSWLQAADDTKRLVYFRLHGDPTWLRMPFNADQYQIQTSGVVVNTMGIERMYRLAKHGCFFDCLVPLELSEAQIHEIYKEASERFEGERV